MARVKFECNPQFFFLKMLNASRFCMSSLRRGHANLLCIIPILVNVQPQLVNRVRDCERLLSVTFQTSFRVTLIFLVTKKIFLTKVINYMLNLNIQLQLC